MVGTDRVLPPGHSIPSLRRVGIRVGEPLTFEAYRDHRPAAQARRAITDEVMKAIGGLSGQEYVPMFASVRGRDAGKLSLSSPRGNDLCSEPGSAAKLSVLSPAPAVPAPGGLLSGR